MKRYRLVFLLLCVMSTSCSIAVFLPEAMITFRVVDEDGAALSGCEVGVGFERNTGSSIRMASTHGMSGSSGIFVAKGRTTGLVTFRVSKLGFYDSTGEIRFRQKENRRWLPWNQETIVAMRRKIQPVPMYARRLSLNIPADRQGVGFDLVRYDWVKPVGTGDRSDIIFKISGSYRNQDDFNSTLTLDFGSGGNGILEVRQNMRGGSEFKLPRLAPDAPYQPRRTKTCVKKPGQMLQRDYQEDIGYVLKLRGEGQGSEIMYGKIQGDIEFYTIDSGTASVQFTYYINPDHSRNLEYDPVKNLFFNLPSFDTPNLLK